MIAISLPATRGSWSTMSFTSTLYLYPVLDLLLAKIPSQLQPEIRLGLQEALVNAAKHGNKLDPSKTIVVQFAITKDGYSWIISDEGCGFSPDCDCICQPTELLPSEDYESGRGLCLLHQIFDRVQWNREGSELRLCKQIRRGRFNPLLC
ncbi:MAG: anti-sigma regulatory factor [Hydrococcus sp. C42_A2020_068]|uniref:ATP-binding protein n=1 Tax=Pleurocapsa sp. PCC 7327 TaxID=118163 RepID=UPI00029FE7C2|nr:anti-sigma regulatory factor [Pleurocapsa sp. PCC 7327]AFY77313.1 anti-sigma regulatory factor (Ser/Thr protein kinase) [Pleurocapsa sp. PCC 7327]MBF2022755.1 anti-sigma regulatory factor [Hydrococcus sp. C42_A2020_068]